MRFEYTLSAEDPTESDVAELLAFHLAEMFAVSPTEKVHTMSMERLREPDVIFFSARHDGRLAAVGALKRLDSCRGEIKSMRAAPAFRGKGGGEAILIHIMQEARCRGYTWLGLETGRSEPFQPAHRLYAKHGFAECPAFAEYVPDEFSLCMSRTL